MKLLKIVIFMTSLFVVEIPAQSNWELQNPWPGAASLNCIWPLNENSVVITGLFTLISTNDAGTTWTNKQLPSEYGGEKIFFQDSLIGWIISFDKLSKTTDGGNSWKEVFTGINTSKYFYSDLTFSADHNGWLLLSPLSTYYFDIINTPGKLFKTTDGGNSWKELPLQAKGELFSISTNDGQFIKITGTDSVTQYGSKTCLYSSSDGGSTWLISAGPESGSSKGGKTLFLSPDIGWMGAYKTNNGGKSWSLKAPSENLYFDDFLRIWALKDTSVYCSYDGGDNWTHLFYGERYSRFSDIRFSNENNGWICGSRGIIYKTTDGGQNWVKINRGFTDDLFDVDFVDELSGWAVGSSGTILHTFNGGLSWEKQNSGVSSILCSVQFINNQLGWATGNEYVLKTSDGGLSWTKNLFIKDANFESLHFLNENTGWVVGGPGIILKTTDSGISWHSQLSNYFKELSDVCFVDSINGWICGNFSLLSTSDGGISWSSQFSPEMQYLKKVQFIDKYNGWITNGADGGFFYTTDGGQKWIQTPLENIEKALSGIRNFHFYNANTGWANSFFWSDVAKTSDGGLTWNSSERLPSTSMRAIKFLDEDLGWAVGDNGAIFRYNNISSGLYKRKDLSVDINLELFPNPFNSQANLRFYLSEDQLIHITVFDITGKIVENFQEKFFIRGEHTFFLNADGYSSGIYLIKVQGNYFSKTIKCILIK